VTRRPSPALANAVAPGVRVEHIEPLQTRIERNRRKFLGFMLAFTSSIAVAVGLTVGLAATLLALAIIFRLDPDLWTSFSSPARFVTTAAAVSVLVTLAITWTWSLVRLARSELWLVKRLDARMPKAGTLLPTKSALRDMAIAAGLPATPQLYVIETPKVNAFVIGRSPERVRIGVTSGFLERVVIDEQRAVFAHLIARVLTRETLWATAVSALMGPIWAMRDYDLRYEPPDTSEGERTGHTPAQKGEDGRAGALVFYGLAVVITEVLSWYHRTAAWNAAEKADAEGMMLLKDPRSMLRAIENVLERDNHVPTAGDAYSQLFFCWAGFGFAPEDDPEMRRVARLREALGAEGAAYVPRPNVPGWPKAPAPPRIELAAEAAGEGTLDET